MNDWRKILEMEHRSSQPGDPFAPPRRCNLLILEMGRFVRSGASESDSPAVRHARMLAHALERLPLCFPDGQFFFGGAELLFRDELPEHVSEQEYAAAFQAWQSAGIRYFGIGHDHAIVDSRTLLRQGLGGLIERARMGEEAFGTEAARAMRMALEAVAAFFRRSGEFCRVCGREEAAARLLHLAGSPPRDFAEAIQLLWLLFVVSEGQGRRHMALGRLDQYLLPFCRDTGEELEMLCHLWAKIEGFHEVTNLCIGGVTPEGENAENPLSFLMLRATGLVHSASTNLSARLHSASSAEFLRGCVELIRSRIGFPAVFNDHVIVPMLERFGIPAAAARDVAFVGCVEASVPGRQPAWSDGRFNLPQIFTGVMRRLKEFDSFDALWGTLAGEVRRGLEAYAEECNAALAAHPASAFPDPLFSALTRGCLESGRDINDGGAEFPRFHGIGMMGLATMADGLCAVRRLVFREKRIDAGVLVAALENDFADAEILRRTLLNCAPKYGNDEPECDELAARIVALCGEEVARLKMADGGCFFSCMASNINNISAGRVTGATPDGRRAGEPLSDAASPQGGRDFNGPTAFVNSIVRPDYSLQNCTVVNMRFQPEMFADESGCRCMETLLRRFVAGGGQEMQFNVSDDATLLDAMTHPENYGDLIVRVSGFSAFFTRLAPEVQRDILRRNAHGMR